MTDHHVALRERPLFGAVVVLTQAKLDSAPAILITRIAIPSVVCSFIRAG